MCGLCSSASSGMVNVLFGRGGGLVGGIMDCCFGGEDWGVGALAACDCLQTRNLVVFDIAT